MEPKTFKKIIGNTMLLITMGIFSIHFLFKPFKIKDTKLKIPDYYSVLNYKDMSFYNFDEDSTTVEAYFKRNPFWYLKREPPVDSILVSDWIYTPDVSLLPYYKSKEIHIGSMGAKSPKQTSAIPHYNSEFMHQHNLEQDSIQNHINDIYNRVRKFVDKKEYMLDKHFSMSNLKLFPYLTKELEREQRLERSNN